MQDIAVLYLDEEDKNAWEHTLRRVPHLLHVTAGADATALLERVREPQINPRLIVLSAELYPSPHPELVGLLRDACPEVEILLISREGSAPPLRTLFQDRIRHLAVKAGQESSGCKYLPEVIEMLAQRRGWDLLSGLKEGTVLHSHRLRSSDDKEPVIAKLEEILAGEGEEMDLLRQKGALLADELLENAMYNAPRGGHGDRLFSKGERRAMLPGERITFSFGFDGETLALALSDNWGSLDPDQVLEYLSLNEEEALDSDEAGGRGLFIIWRFFDGFHVAVKPGQRTTVGGHLQLSSKLPPEAPRGFHIINNMEDIAA